MIKERWFSAAAIAAIALGIGANTLGFTIINAAFIRGFHFERAEELHASPGARHAAAGCRRRCSISRTGDRNRNRSPALAASTFGAINISDDHAAPEQTQGARVTANLFDVLRQRPLLGRTFVDGEDRRGAEPVVIIGYDIWTNRFDRDPGVIGRILSINGSPATIVGVMPERMKFPETTASCGCRSSRPMRSWRATCASLSVFGRLAAGVSARAGAEPRSTASRSASSRPIPIRPRPSPAAQVETLRRALPERRGAAHVSR